MDIKSIATPEFIQTVLIIVVLPFIVRLINTGVSHIESKTKNETVNKYIDIAEDAIVTAVTAVTQTIVDAAKKNGAFDQAAREEAFYQAKSQALSIMTSEAKKAISEAYGDLNAWIDNKIEFYVKTGKPG